MGPGIKKLRIANSPYHSRREELVDRRQGACTHWGKGNSVSVNPCSNIHEPSSSSDSVLHSRRQCMAQAVRHSVAYRNWQHTLISIIHLPGANICLATASKCTRRQFTHSMCHSTWFTFSTAVPSHGDQWTSTPLPGMSCCRASWAAQKCANSLASRNIDEQHKHSERFVIGISLLLLLAFPPGCIASAIGLTANDISAPYFRMTMRLLL